MNENREHPPTTNHHPSEYSAKPYVDGDTLHSLLSACLAESRLQSKLLLAIAFEQAVSITTAMPAEGTQATLMPILGVVLGVGSAWSLYRRLGDL
jgi:hypothetical protein